MPADNVTNMRLSHAYLYIQKVERELTSKGEDRRSMGREAFLEYAWKYKEDKAGAIVDQIRRLGASADWSKQKFTLDPDVRDHITYI
jgi:valyl-tRNA synthetase